MNTILNLLSHFKNQFQGEPIVVAAPARINLIGEHTDYNGGLVFPASIDKYIYCAIAESQEEFCQIVALDLEETYEFQLDKVEKQESGSWKNYVLGVVWGILQKNKKIGNFKLMFSGNIPLGAGLSSSAALENSIVFALNELFHLKLSKSEMLEISVQSEHLFAGVLCGVMDQFASLNGKSNQAILLDTLTLSHQYIPLELGDYELLLLNTNVKHQLSDSPYNQRKEQCKMGFKLLQSKFPLLASLSHTNLEQLAVVKDKMSKVVYQRCQYVIEENDRVKASKIAIERKDWKSFGELLFASHKGLKNLYKVSCEELDFLVDLAVEQNGVLGSRMMGGGFGGCTLNLVHRDKREAFVEEATQRYKEKFGLKLDCYSVHISEGTRRI